MKHHEKPTMPSAKPTAEPPIADKEKGVRFGHIRNLFESKGTKIIQSHIESLGHGIFRWTITIEEKEGK